MNITRLLLFGLITLSALPAWAQRDLTEIPDPDPMKELARLRVPEGFEINLFASDPEIAKPIQTNWDAQGRLWVATSSVYPLLKPGEVANDKIVILEDTDGDGHADKSTVFADGLLIPTGVLPARNGAYVANSTELLFLEDTDGDDVADERHVVLSGFGTEDTHHILHTLRRGPGGYIYFNQSIYIHSNIETPWGPKRLDGGGVWRFRPETLELNVWVRGFVNPWGHRFNDWGQEFVTDGAFGEGVNYVFPGAAFVTAVGAERILHGLSPGQPKHCGLAILSGRHLPEDYRGTFITNDFRGNRVNRFVIEESQSGFAARQVKDLVWTDHVAFRPVDASMGPDGAIYIIDWYNPIIQHGEVDFRDPRRDRKHGRIWRITRKGSPLLKRSDLTNAEPAEIVAALGSENRWTRNAARQLIGEAGRETMEPVVREYWKSLDADDAGFARKRLECLWALQSLDVYDNAITEAVLTSDDHRARAAAVRVLTDGADELKSVQERLARAINDPHPRVRLEAINGLRRIAAEGALRASLAALEHPIDENIDYALWLTARELQGQWLPKVAEDPNYFGDVNRLIFALNAAARPEVIAPAMALWPSEKLSNEQRGSLASIIGRYGQAENLAVLAEQEVLNDPAKRIAALDALLEASRRRTIAPPNAKNVLALLDSKDTTVRVRAAELAGRYRLPEAPDRLSSLINDKQTPEELRVAAVKGLAADTTEAALKQLADIAKSHPQSGTRAHALAAWAGRKATPAASAAVAFLANGATEQAASQVTEGFLTVPGGPKALTAALQGKSLPQAIAAAALRTVSTSSQKSEALIKALRAAGDVEPLMENLTAEQLAKLIADMQEHGDPARGELIYRSDELTCLKCHAIGGSGGEVGPDLTSIGASAPPDYLVASLLQPSDKIKEGYHTTTVVRGDGTIAAGVLIRETDEELVLRDNNGAEITIPTDNVIEQVISPVSLMPKGLTKKIRRDQLVDLLAFLSQLGRPGPYRVSPTQNYVRTWRVLDANDEVSRTLRANGVAVTAREPDSLPWQTAHSLVSGELPLASIPIANYFSGQKFRILQFKIETPEAGPAELKFSQSEGLSGFVGTDPVEWSETTRVELPAGQTLITIVLDTAKFSEESLRIEVKAIPDSTAQPRPVHDF